MEKAERVNWKKRAEDLGNAEEALKRLEGENRKSYHFSEHVENLRRIKMAGEGEYPRAEEIYHAILIMAYNEGEEILAPSIEAVKATNFPNERIIMVLGYEERGGEEMEKTAKKLAERYKNTFYRFILAKHPADLKGEIVGKGSNLVNAGIILVEQVRFQMES